MRLFNFDNWVWKNQRWQIRETGSESLWYKALQSFLRILENRSQKITWLWDNLNFETSYGYGLDLWGARYRIPRLAGENDVAYKDRINFQFSYKQTPGNTANLKKIVAQLVGTSSEKIIIERVYPHHYVMGGAIGSPVSTRDYAHYTYRIYVPKEIVVNEIQRGLILWAISTIETAGSLYELWEYTTEDTGIKTQRLSETPIDAKSQFRVS